LCTPGLTDTSIPVTIIPNIMDAEFEMEVMDQSEAERELGASGGRGRTSQYEPIAQKWADVGKDEAIVLTELAKKRHPKSSEPPVPTLRKRERHCTIGPTGRWDV